MRAAAAEASIDPCELWFSTFALVELIEAASRSGRSERAAEALALLGESTRASGTPWAFVVEARSRHSCSTVPQRRRYIETRSSYYDQCRSA